MFINLFVKDIRLRRQSITTEPIIYYWWFKDQCLSKLLLPLGKEINKEKITFQSFEGVKYALLYIGKGKNGNNRLVKYHILDSQNFHNSGVKNGRLSSLRQTLCGLLGTPMSTSKEFIDRFIDDNCIVQFHECSANQVNALEAKIILENYLPLNYHYTREILTTNHRKILKNLKKKMKY